MSILLPILILTYLSGIFARLNIKTKSLEKNYRNYNSIFIIIVSIFLIIISGFRYRVGTDYLTYSRIYTINIPKLNINEIVQGSDMAFGIMCKYLYNISNDPQLMFLISATITVTLVIITLRKYSSEFELSLYLYIATFSYFTSFNILRQWIAGAIIFSGLKYIINRNWKRYFFIVIIGSLFHASAIVMIPVYFIANVKPKSKTNLILIITTIIGVVFYNQLLSPVFNLLQDSQYANYYNELVNINQGVSIVRVIVYMIPIIIAYIFYEKINIKNDKKIDMIINLSFIGMLFMVLAIKHKYIARITALFDPYYLLLIPYCINIGDKKIRKIIYLLIVVCYFAYCYLLLMKGEGNIYPYQFKNTLF